MKVETKLTELAPGGDAVAIVEVQGERRAVFVRGGAPGDRVTVEVDLSKRPARGRLLQILEQGPGRVQPPCPHVHRCGGCDWMHLSADTRRDALLAQVAAALPWKDVPIAWHASPSPLAYRARARVHARASGGRAIVGMNEARSHDPVEVDACAVLDPRLEPARRLVASVLEGTHGTGDAQLALGTAKPVIDLRWTGSLTAEVFARLERAVSAGDIAGARIFTEGSSRPAQIGDPTAWMAGADGEPLRLGSFGQASESANAVLGKRVAAIAGTMSERAVELYAGAGNLTVMLARVVPEIVAVESSRESCEAARANLDARGLTNARVVEADAATYAWKSSTRLLLLDPPRAGAKEAAARLVTSPVKHVLYVSCDPQTLGRDLRTLLPAGYTPVTIEAFEMFPQTSHVETVVALRRKR
jgi:23S rRNA (uracil1939-C5)-methyltransferase